MQEEVNEKVFGLCVTGSKITAQILKQALSNMLNHISRYHEKEVRKEEIKKGNNEKYGYKGKQSLRSLRKKGAELTNIEITDKNIKSFERYARKYNVEYSLKKDKSVIPPRYYVFFKAKDVDSMTAAFKEYTGKTFNKNKSSIREALRNAIIKTKSKNRQRQRVRTRKRGVTR